MTSKESARIYVVDTCVLIDLLQRNSAPEKFQKAERLRTLARNGEIKLIVPIAILPEIYSLNKGNDRPISKEDVEQIDRLLNGDEFVLYPVDLRIGRIAQRLRMRYSGFDAVDSFVAATHIAHKTAAVVTGDGSGLKAGIIKTLNGKDYDGWTIRAITPDSVQGQPRQGLLEEEGAG